MVKNLARLWLFALSLVFAPVVLAGPEGMPLPVYPANLAQADYADYEFVWANYPLYLGPLMKTDEEGGWLKYPIHRANYDIEHHRLTPGEGPDYRLVYYSNDTAGRGALRVFRKVPDGYELVWDGPKEGDAPDYWGFDSTSFPQITFFNRDGVVHIVLNSGFSRGSEKTHVFRWEDGSACLVESYDGNPRQ